MAQGATPSLAPVTAFGAAIVTQSADPLPPESPKPPIVPGEAREKIPSVPDSVDSGADQVIHLLDVLHQQSETKLRVKESGGVEVIYGEDGEPISAQEAQQRKSEINLKSSLRKSNARLGFSIGLFLFISYLILRGQSGRMVAR